MVEFNLKKLSDRVWYLPANHETDRPVLGAVIGDKHTLLIDSGNSPVHAALFLEALKGLNVPQSKLLVITHWHWDHIFGMSKMNLPAISHEKTKTYIDKLLKLSWTDEALDERVQSGEEIAFCAEMIKKEFGENRDEIKIVSPVITFKDSLLIDLGGVKVTLKHVGGDHSDDSTVVYVEDDRILFIGDSYSPNIYAQKWNYVAPVFLELLDKLEGFNADIYLHSHSVPATKEEFFKETEELRIITLAAEQHKGDKEKIHSAIRLALGRDLNNDDIEFAAFFEN